MKYEVESEYEFIFPWWFDWYLACYKFFAGLMQVECQLNAQTNWFYRQALLRAKVSWKGRADN